MMADANAVKAATDVVSNSTLIILGAGFAVQRLIEIFDPLFTKKWPDATKKKLATALIASVIGALFTLGGKFTLIYDAYPSLLKANVDRWDFFRWLINLLVTGLAVGAGTEGVNSVLKLAQYSKEGKKSEGRAKPALNQPPPTADAAEALARRAA
jgi:hypothetical protein